MTRDEAIAAVPVGWRFLVERLSSAKTPAGYAAIFSKPYS